jgi:hypothetical protein
MHFTSLDVNHSLWTVNAASSGWYLFNSDHTDRWIIIENDQKIDEVELLNIIWLVAYTV